MTLDLSPWHTSINAYADWLSDEDKTAATKWSQRLRSPQPDKVEGAVAEALIYDYIGCRVDSVHLTDRPGVGGLDFEFAKGDVRFLVEVTNLSIDAVTKASGMPDTDSFNTGFYGLLTDRIRQKVRNKLKQAKNQSQYPLLVAVTTLHWNASCVCINRKAVEFAMNSPPNITSKWNPNTGESEGEPYQSTDLSRSVFLSPTPVLGPDGEPVAQARYEPISGFLLGGFGLRPPDAHVFAGLNPEARIPFDPSMFPDVPTCFFAEWPVSTELKLEWTISEEEGKAKSLEAAERRLRADGLGNMLDELKREARSRNSQ